VAVVLDVFELHLLFCSYGGVKQVRRVKHTLVTGLGELVYIELTVELFGLMDARQSGQLLDELFAFGRGNEARRLNRVHEHFQLREFKLAIADKVLQLTAFIAYHINAAGDELVYVALDGLPSTREASLGQVLDNLRDGNGVLFIGLRIQKLQ